MVSQTTTTIENEVIQDLPFALSFAEKFFPTLRVIDPILLQILPAAIAAVNTIVEQTGANHTQAAAAVAAHLTPGLPNLPALSPAQVGAVTGPKSS